MMENPMDQPVFKKPSPSAVRASRATQKDADEDLVLTVLAAVLRQLEGKEEAQTSYHRYRFGDSHGVGREVSDEKERTLP